MAQVTSGSVTYERVRKDDDYGINRKAAATFSFTVPEGEDHAGAAAQIIKHAIGIVHGAIQIAGSPATASVQAASPETARVSPSATPVKEGAALPASDKEAAAIRLNAADEATKPRGRPPGVGKKPEAAKETPAVVEAEKPVSTPKASEDLNDILGIGTTPPAPPVTDAELTAAIQKKNTSIGKPQVIRALIGEFIPPPGQAREIAQDKRHEFLKKLDALT